MKLPVPSIDYRLNKIKQDLDKLLNGDSIEEKNEQTTPEQLSCVFGLSLSQANAWLKKEPNYLSDGSYHEHKTDDKLPEPDVGFCKVYICFFFCKNPSVGL